VINITKKYNVSPAQVVLRWAIQRGTAIIPKSKVKERLIENLNLSNFSLSNDEMISIDRLNKSRRFNDPGQFCLSGFKTFFPIYE